MICIKRRALGRLCDCLSAGCGACDRLIAAWAKSDQVLRLPTIRAMRILIANDDGYLAPGIAALVQACQGLGEIDVIAPEQNASGTSNALSLTRPLTVHEARGEPVQ